MYFILYIWLLSLLYPLPLLLVFEQFSMWLNLAVTRFAISSLLAIENFYVAITNYSGHPEP